MSTPPQPPEPLDRGDDGPYVPVSPLLAEDPPKIGPFWLDARLGATPAGVAFTGHQSGADTGRDRDGESDDRAAMIILLSQGAAADPAARDRLAGMVNRQHIDSVLARGGQGQDYGRLGRRFQQDPDTPVTPDDVPLAPWVALAYAGTPADAALAEHILDQVQLATLPQQGAVAGPDYRHYWVERVRPGLTRLWPLPWPGRYDRAGWRTILVSWLLMLLLAALAILIAILIFHNQAPQSPPTPTGGSASPPPQSASASPQSASPSSGSASPSRSGSGSPSPSKSGSPTTGSASPSPSPSGGGGGTDTASPSTSSSPGSRL